MCLFSLGCGKLHFAAIPSAKDNINLSIKLDKRVGLADWFLH